MNRNLSNFNHWIAELRDIARKKGAYIFDEESLETTPMTESQIKHNFSKLLYQDLFEDGDTPEEAYDYTIIMWNDWIKQSQL